MESVMAFNSELAALYECKPPISRAKMTSITKAAIKALKCYKHVVQSVEKFIQKCKTDYKIPGLYVIDSIVRQSRHQFGPEKDVFAPRFGKNILITFYHLFKCPAQDKSRVIRVLNLWQKNSVFEEEIIQPVFDLADPNHPTYREVSSQIHQKAVKAACAKQHVPPPSHTTPQYQHTPQTPQQTQTPQSSHSVTSVPPPSSASTVVVSSVSNPVNNTVVSGLDPNLIQQIQQILMKTEESAVASSVAVLSNLSNQPSSFLQGQQPPILGITNQASSQPSQVPIHQPPPSIIQPQGPPPMILEQQPSVPSMSSAGDFDERTLSFVDTSLPPPGYMQNFSNIPHVMSMPNISQKPPSPKEEGEHSGESDEDKENHQDDVIQIDDQSRSPSYPRSRRNRKRSRTRSRSRSRHHRSRSRGRRSRSRDRNRRHRDRDRGRPRRDSDKDQEREKEKERKKKGLPPVKPDHISICSTTLWVGHLSKLVHQEELSDTFGEYGDIVSIDLIPPRGCAFICMNRRQDAARSLLKLRNYKILNKAITIAWAPGKGVKAKDFKDYWEVEAGCSYVPYSKLKSIDSVDLDALEEGGMIDEDTVPSWLKGKLSARLESTQKEAQMAPQPGISAMTVLPPVSNPLGIVQALGKELVNPMMSLPFSLPSVPPPRIQHRTMPPLGPPLMPPLGVPPPIGLPPLTSVPTILGPPLIHTVPPHISVAATPHLLGPPPTLVAEQGAGSSTQDSDSMDVEMEDVQRSETETMSVDMVEDTEHSAKNASFSSNQPMDVGDEESNRNNQKSSGFPQSQDVHMLDMQPGNSPNTRHPPPIIRPGSEHMGIRFGIVPRVVPGFAPRGIGIGGFLGPPPIVGGRPGIVPEGPRAFMPMGPSVDVSINKQFAGSSPRFPVSDRSTRRMEEEKGEWGDQDGERRKYRNKNEPWNAEVNMYGNAENGRRLDRNGRSEPEDDSNRYRDRNRMRESEESPRNHNSHFRSYDRGDRSRDRGRDHDRDRNRDRMRDRYERDQLYGRDRYKDDRRDQWGGRGRWEERRDWHNERKPWNEEGQGWKDRWNPNYEREQIEDNSGWMNSEAYAFQQGMLQTQETPNVESDEKICPEIEQPQIIKEPVPTDKSQNLSEKIPQNQRKERDSTRVSRWERQEDNTGENVIQATVPELPIVDAADMKDVHTEISTSVTVSQETKITSVDKDNILVGADSYDPFEVDSENPHEKPTQQIEKEQMSEDKAYTHSGINDFPSQEQVETSEERVESYIISKNESDETTIESNDFHANERDNQNCENFDRTRDSTNLTEDSQNCDYPIQNTRDSTSLTEDTQNCDAPIQNKDFSDNVECNISYEGSSGYAGDNQMSDLSAEAENINYSNDNHDLEKISELSAGHELLLQCDAAESNTDRTSDVFERKIIAPVELISDETDCPALESVNELNLQMTKEIPTDESTHVDTEC